MVSEGFVKLGRHFFRGELWSEERCYSRAGAWLDLVMQARFDTSPVTRHVGGTSVVTGRGQLACSLRYLARRWGWSVHRVRGFLGYLANSGMTETGTAAQCHVLSIAHFGQYSGLPAGSEPFTPPSGASRGPAARPSPASRRRAGGHTSGTLAGTNKKKSKEKKETSLTGGKETAGQPASPRTGEDTTCRGTEPPPPASLPARAGRSARSASCARRWRGSSRGSSASR